MTRPKDLSKFIDEAEQRSQDIEITPNIKKVKTKETFSLSFIEIFDRLSVTNDDNYKKIKKELATNAKNRDSDT
jgi:hypothetical protein